MKQKNLVKEIAFIIIFAVVVIFIAYFQTQKKEQTQTKQILNKVFYSCDSGKTISAIFYDGENKAPVEKDAPPVPTGSVDIALSDGRKMTLPQTISADGARYSNKDESFVFWSKGNGALVLENNIEKSFIGCILVAPQKESENLSKVYSNSKEGFSIRLPEDFKVDEKYKYEAGGPGKEINGIKFGIPSSFATGTNLSSDSYISVEEIPQAKECDAKNFLNSLVTSRKINDMNTEYSYATSSDAAAGNRYEESVYVLPDTNPCVAVRYFVHFGVFENYPTGAVKEFDRQALLKEFDNIRQTLIINQ